MEHPNSLTYSPNNIYYKTNVYYEGYWRKTEDGKMSSDDLYYQSEYVGLPFPKPMKVKSDELKLFIEDLKLVESKIYGLDGGSQSYMGYSKCRCCGIENGIEEFHIEYDKNSVLVWPCGLIHYYQEHNIIPSKKFYDFIGHLAEKAKKIPVVEMKPLTEEDIKKIHECELAYRYLMLMDGMGALKYT